MRRAICLLLTAVCVLSLCAPLVRAEENEPEEMGHLALLELLCAGYPSGSDEHISQPPLYIQQNYPDVAYGAPTGTIALNGCGLAALAMLSSYMLDEIHDPVELAGYFQRYATPTGTEYRLMDLAAPYLGFRFIKRTGNWQEVKEVLAQGQMAISLQRKGPFTSSYHYILLTGITEDGKVLIRDSHLVNHEERFGDTDYFENGFPEEVVTKADYIFWIYGKKELHHNCCNRCADPEVGVISPAAETYYCSKCAKFLRCRDAYHETMGSFTQN